MSDQTRRSAIVVLPDSELCHSPAIGVTTLAEEIDRDFLASEPPGSLGNRLIEEPRIVRDLP